MKMSLLKNMKMPTIVGIFIFISRENFMRSRVEHKGSFITLGPDCIDVQTDRYLNCLHDVAQMISAIKIYRICHTYWTYKLLRIATYLT